MRALYIVHSIPFHASAVYVEASNATPLIVKRAKDKAIIMQIRQFCTKWPAALGHAELYALSERRPKIGLRYERQFWDGFNLFDKPKWKLHLL